MYARRIHTYAHTYHHAYGTALVQRREYSRATRNNLASHTNTPIHSYISTTTTRLYVDIP